MANHQYKLGDTVNLYSASPTMFRAVITGKYAGRHGGPKYTVNILLPSGALSTRETSLPESNIRGLADEQVK